MKTKLDKNLKKDIAAGKSGEVDFNKVYFNGHKFFDAQQSKAHKELLQTESRVAENFHVVKKLLVRPRNPINCDPTPRDERGEAVLNPNLHGKVFGGTLIFTDDYYSNTENRESLSRFSEKRPTEKIGVDEGRYDILGRTGETLGSSLLSQSLVEAVRDHHAKKVEDMKDKETLNALIMKQKAKRHEKELNRELSVLRRQSDEKSRELDYIKQTYLFDEK